MRYAILVGAMVLVGCGSSTSGGTGGTGTGGSGTGGAGTGGTGAGGTGMAGMGGTGTAGKGAGGGGTAGTGTAGSGTAGTGTAGTGTAGTSTAGSAGSGTAGSGTAGAGGAGGGMVDTTILGAFEDPSAPACHDCLKAMTGTLTLVDGSKVDCSKVTAACGAKDEKCAAEVSCIDAYVTANPTVKLDCAVDKCLSTQPEANDFFNCAADRCGTECTLTIGFTTTNCPLSVIGQRALIPMHARRRTRS